MSASGMYYISGEEVHAGDRVQFDGNYATVVFLSSGEIEEFAPGYEDYTGMDAGVLLCDDDGGTRMITGPDERLAFIDRS